QTAALDFPRLDGGLNLSETEERLKPNESPEMENLWWEDGALCSRPGQQRIDIAADNGLRRPGPGFAATDAPFFGSLFFHLGSRLYRWDGETDQDGKALLKHLDLAGTGARDVPMNAGTFFRFGDFLFYKNRGSFRKIAYDSVTRSFTVTDVAKDAFVPTILINADPFTGAGDLYQPENRLSHQKTVLYNAAVYQEKGPAHTGDGSRRIFSIGGTSQSGIHAVAAVYVGGTEVPSALWDGNLRTGYLTFRTPPAAGDDIVILLERNNPVYSLPVRDVREVTEVRVDGKRLKEGTDYTVNRVYGQVTFTTAPPVHDPPVSSTVSITYSKESRDKDGVLAAYNAVMECPSAAVCGTGTQLCIVLGGCPAQPNAVFWSGNNQLGLDPSYWPMEYYNLAGGTGDPVTGFGKQYGDLLVFQAGSLGKLACSTVELNGRNLLSLAYTRVNNKIGCDLPGSIQLIENNLVFANSAGGVYRVCSSSPAYENNVVCVSAKVNGSQGAETPRPGLL
ncbi:MAG: hypothetical protein IJT94_05235, partial [Oscillibacter sp.]|nr:hypothetical protein [Oscillibacter sp.]